MKFVLLLAAVLTLSLSCGIGEKPIANENSDTASEGVEIEIVIDNDLDHSEITEIWVDPSDEPWSENRLDSELVRGDTFTLTLNEEAEYDLQLIDDYGESYTILNQSIDLDGFEWEVVDEDADWNRAPTGEWTTVSIENGLRNQAIWYCYAARSSDEDWGTELLDYMVLEAGESFSFDVESGDYYDFYARNAESDFYFSFDNYIDDSGLTWAISSSDRDNTMYEDETHGASAAVTLINRLGNVNILYAYKDESGGEYWGADLLDGDVLEPRDDFTFYLSPDKFYDFQVEDDFGNTYTLWEVAVKDNGIFWEVIQDDMDN